MERKVLPSVIHAVLSVRSCRLCIMHRLCITHRAKRKRGECFHLGLFSSHYHTSRSPPPHISSLLWKYKITKRLIWTHLYCVQRETQILLQKQGRSEYQDSRALFHFDMKIVAFVCCIIFFNLLPNCLSCVIWLLLNDIADDDVEAYVWSNIKHNCFTSKKCRRDSVSVCLVTFSGLSLTFLIIVYHGQTSGFNYDLGFALWGTSLGLVQSIFVTLDRLCLDQGCAPASPCGKKPACRSRIKFNSKKGIQYFSP